MYNENEFRKDIINKFLAVPVLGENYMDWHTKKWGMWANDIFR